MLPKRSLSEEKVALEIDLKKLFGKSITDPGIRRAIGESLIDKIISRTESGQGVDGKGQVVKLKSPYSDPYVNSIEFKAFDKSKTKVNMKLTGSMLASIDMIDDRSDKISIGIDNEDAPKAFNHITGDTVPSRPFLGLTAKDLDEVKKEFEKEIKSDEPVTAKDVFERNNLAKLARLVTKRIVGFDDN